MPALLIDLLTALVSLLGGGLLVNSEVRKVLRILFAKVDLLPKGDNVPYTDKIQRLTNVEGLPGNG